MPIQGLSNQWQTFDALINEFAEPPDDDAPGNVVEKYRMIRQLLAKIHTSTGSTIYVGTSHSQLNFGTGDAISNDDRTQPFAYVDVELASKKPGEHFFRVETREIERNRPTTKWTVRKTTDADAVAKLLLEALRYADIPPRTSTSG